ncbi:hypothetical protein [Proteiniborus sp. MB09-C3]|uniref:hypothetical protein n=1 Tax=Proteiniborus sp. MB09-C3 TaxID=3050072 RepID=UPI002555D660|nr:hypothetical protein [Proteiniborus sp. MB09-C3]WIV11345.1 hypothetical protein QO263_14465 [Proteiniborus sp. MB09-C3]
MALTDNIRELYFLEEIKRNCKLYMKLSRGEYKTENLIEIKKFWDSFLVSNDTTLLSTIRIPLIIKPDSNMELINRNFINLGISILLEDYEQAYSYGLKWLKDYEAHRNIPFYNYVSSITSILYLISCKYTPNQIKELISNYNVDTLILDSIDDILNKNIKNLMPQVSCYKCETCDFFCECKYYNEKELLLNLLSYSFK